MKRKKVAIVGLGLIGGSIALRLHEKKIASRLIGVEADPVHSGIALEMELVDEIVSMEDAIREAEVIILAIPVDQIILVLPGLMNKIDDHIIIDLGSTKHDIVRAVKDHPKRGRYVATHPMWGTEHSGPRAVVKTAFENKALIICDSRDSDEDALEWVRTMYRKIGMHIIEMDSADHDLHAAYVSHVSHISSFALANTVLEKEKQENTIFELASSGFESTVRLAKSHPQMWVPIFKQNKENVLDVLNEHIVQLKKFKSSLEKENWDYLQELIENANRIRKILK